VTKPAVPRAGHDDGKVVEIDAIDGAEWERDQHTPQAPVAGLAALVRQTAPVRIEPRPKQPATQPPRAQEPAAPRAATAKGRGRPPRPPAKQAPPAAATPSFETETAPAGASPSFETVTAPAMLSLAAETAQAPRDDDASAAPHHVPPEAVRLPLAAPPSEPIPAPALLIPRPVVVEPEHRLRAAPDHTPAPPALDSFAPPAHTDSPDAATIRPKLASRRVIAIAGATIAAVVAVIVVAATRGAAPGARPAAVAAPTRPPMSAHAVAIDPPPPPARPEHAPAPAARPSPTAAPAADDPPASSLEPARARAAEPREHHIVAAKPHRLRPLPAYRGNRKVSRTVALQPAPHEEPESTEDEPAIARARGAYDAGNQALFAGDSAAAIRAYRQVLGYAPTYAAGFRGLGLAHAQQGDIGAAVMALRTYLTLAPHARDVALIKKRIAILQAQSAERSAQRQAGSSP
jgi:hypothetical protein